MTRPLLEINSVVPFEKSRALMKQLYSAQEGVSRPVSAHTWCPVFASKRYLSWLLTFADPYPYPYPTLHLLQFHLPYRSVSARLCSAISDVGTPAKPLSSWFTFSTVSTLLEMCNFHYWLPKLDLRTQKLVGFLSLTSMRDSRGLC